jgi:GTP-binding protein EngB required for normal cell division
MKFPFLWRKTPSRPSPDSSASTASQPGTVSRILRDVLSPGPAGEPADVPGGGEADKVPLSNRLSVGARLDDAKRRALDAAGILTKLADKETAQAISSVAAQLQGLASCVAFVGQVKAGKSSLINALVEQPEFLPANINPCTAVITRLSFGVPDRPQSGAQFTFFTQEEWRRLSMGGRTRELTDRLFPDFNWEVLRTQVKTMEDKAREKLGTSFEELLGKEHLYEEIQPDLLVRYVGAEQPDSESLPERTEGRFSDITKSADIFLDLGAFSFPTVLIDTPGVNDPFLVRDEITRQNLEAADICVVVVTARQPLSATDINLLRMLRGLKKNRIIIFINKIDELRGGDDVLQEIGRQVSATLKQEFPSAQIPVVFGSAAFAQKALNRDTAEAASNGGTGEEQDGIAGLFQWLGNGGVADKAKAEAYFLKSGLLSLAVAVSGMMSGGPVADSIGSATRLIDSAGRNLIAWLEIEAGLLRRIPLEPEQVKGELEAIIGLRQELAAKFDTFPEKLDAIYAQEVSLIKQRLSSTIQAFIPEALASSACHDTASQACQIDVKLRIRLENVFLNAIEDAGGMLAAEHEALKAELSALLEGRSLAANPAIILGPPMELTPSLAALSEPAALGFTAHLTQLAGAGEGEGTSVNLRDLIVADFAPIIEKLADEASRVFHEGSSAFIRQARALTFGPIDAVAGKVSQALQDAQARPHEDAEANIHAIRESIANLKPAPEARHTSVPAQADGA